MKGKKAIALAVRVWEADDDAVAVETDAQRLAERLFIDVSTLTRFE